MQKEWQHVCEKHAGIHMTTTEPHSPWQNLAEMGIKHLKTHVHRMMRKRNAPASLWEWATCYFALIKSNMASSIPWLKGRTPHKYLTGETPNITKLCQFHWYGLVYYWGENNFPDNCKQLGRFLGVASNIGSAMCYYVLPVQPKMGEMKVLSCSMVHNLMDEERRDPKVRKDIITLDESILRCLGLTV